MFKSYLKYLPKTIQLSVFMCLWAGLLVIVAALQPWLIQSLTHLNADQLADFFNESVSKYPSAYFIINFLSSLGMFALPAILFAYLADPQPLAYLGLKKQPAAMQTILVIILGIILIPFMSSLSGLIRNLDFGNASNELQKTRDAAIQLYLNSSDIMGIAKNVLLMALVPSLFEEIFFRGVLQKMVYSFIKKTWFTFLIVGVIFALFHGSIYEFLPILLGSIIISWVYHYTSSLLLCILLHFINNGLQVILASTNAIGVPADSQADSNTFILTAICSTCLVLTYFILRKLYTIRTPLPTHWNVQIDKQS